MPVLVKPVVPKPNYDAIFEQAVRASQQTQTINDIFKDIITEKTPATFFTRDVNGWLIDGNDVIAVKRHTYGDPIVSREFISKPGESFSLRSSKWTLFGVTPDYFLPRWVGNIASVWLAFSRSGWFCERHIIAEGRGAAPSGFDFGISKDFTYNRESSLFEFKIGEGGSSLSIEVDGITRKTFPIKMGTPLYLAGFGGGDNLHFYDVNFNIKKL